MIVIATFQNDIGKGDLLLELTKRCRVADEADVLVVRQGGTWTQVLPVSVFPAPLSPLTRIDCDWPECISSL